MTPLVGRRQTHRRVFVHPVVAEMDAGTPHRHAQLLPPNSLVRQVDGEEIPPQIEVGTDPQKPLTQDDECHNVLNPVGIKVLQLHLVVIQQLSKELMSRYGESPLVEVSEGHDIPFGRRRLILITRQQPPLSSGRWAEEAAVDEALQTSRGNAGSARQLHCGIEKRWVRA